MKYVISFIVSVVLGLVAAVGIVYSGVVSVAATEPHSGITQWLFSTAMHQSVERHARSVTQPAFDTAAKAKQGAPLYQEMCEGCHGAPGRDRGQVGKGLTPKPPDLSESAAHWETKELYWIIKHGVKMTGMPAWGGSHSEDELWALAAFVKTLPKIGAEEYRRMVPTHDSRRETSGGHNKPRPGAH